MLVTKVIRGRVYNKYLVGFWKSSVAVLGEY